MPHSRSSHSSGSSFSRSPRRHLERAPHRPDRYEVEHRPRRVTPAHRGETAVDEYSLHDEDGQQESKPHKRRVPLQKKLRRLGLGPWEWAGLAVSCVISVFLLGEIVGAQSDHQMLRTQVDHKEQQLAALEKQKQEDQKKLAYLKSEKGREQILAERGYRKPGDRILLFPTEKTEGEPAE